MSPKSKKAKAAGAAGPVSELTFEAAFAELEALVTQLEEGDLALEATLTLFERGQALAARCAQLLDGAELKIQTLTPDGDLVDEAGFDPDETEA